MFKIKRNFGALTSKNLNFTFNGRKWELDLFKTILLREQYSLYINIEKRGDKILRILPVIGSLEWLENRIKFFGFSSKFKFEFRTKTKEFCIKIQNSLVLVLRNLIFHTFIIFNNKIINNNINTGKNILGKYLCLYSQYKKINKYVDHFDYYQNIEFNKIILIFCKYTKTNKILTKVSNSIYEIFHEFHQINKAYKFFSNNSNNFTIILNLSYIYNLNLKLDSELNLYVGDLLKKKQQQVNIFSFYYNKYQKRLTTTATKEITTKQQYLNFLAEPQKMGIDLYTKKDFFDFLNEYLKNLAKNDNQIGVSLIENMTKFNNLYKLHHKEIMIQLMQRGRMSLYDISRLESIIKNKDVFLSLAEYLYLLNLTDISRDISILFELNVCLISDKNNISFTKGVMRFLKNFTNNISSPFCKDLLLSELSEKDIFATFTLINKRLDKLFETLSLFIEPVNTCVLDLLNLYKDYDILSCPLFPLYGSIILLKGLISGLHIDEIIEMLVFNTGISRNIVYEFRNDRQQALRFTRQQVPSIIETIHKFHINSICEQFNLII